MKKLLLSIFAACVAFGVKAETEVVFNFDEDATALFGIEDRSSGSGDSYDASGEFNENGVATLEGVTVTVEASPADAKTRNRLWATSPVLRMYNSTLTVAAPGHNVTKIVFNAPKFDVTVNTGTIDGKTWVSDEAVDEVIFTVVSNTQIKTMTVTLDGEIGEEPPVVELAGTGEGTIESPYDVERALSIIENDVCSADNVYIKGTIVSIEEYSIDYGNATYTIGQDGTFNLKVYRGYGLAGKKFTEEGEIEVDDEVVVCGKLITSYGGEVATGSSIYSLNGETAPDEPPYTCVGDGSKENPYTVADIQHLNILESDGTSYWVKGYILGSCTSATKLNDAENAVDTNIALGETADATEFIPVALPANSIMRETLGVATNPENVGKEAMVYGTLEKYFSVAGVKNVTACVINGETISSTIDAIDTTDAPVKYYNIQGIEVANPLPGQLYIRVQGDKVTKVIR